MNGFMDYWMDGLDSDGLGPSPKWNCGTRVARPSECSVAVSCSGLKLMNEVECRMKNWEEMPDVGGPLKGRRVIANYSFNIEN